MANTEQFYKKASEPGVYDVEEPIIGYKKIFCSCDSSFPNSIIPAVAELLIPQGATIIKPVINNKYRTDKAIVKRITPSNDASGYIKQVLGSNFLYEKCICYSWYNPSYSYHIGKMHEPRSLLDKNIRDDCSSGIHFFAERSRAENFQR